MQPQFSDSSGLTVASLSKTFGETRALDDVSAHFPGGSITALLGQNGSGKSTLIKVVAGFYSADGEPEIAVGGVRLPTPVSPRVAHDAGLRFLHQDLALVEAESIADNFAFADRYHSGLLGLIRQGQENARVARALARFGIDRDPSTIVRELTPTERTMVAIARAFVDERDDPSRNHVLVLDEPTASLPASEVERVFGALQHVRDSGGAVIFVSHRIDEVLRIADRVVVLRDGRLVAEQSMQGLAARDLVKLIVGSDFETGVQDKKPVSHEVSLEVRELSGPRLKGVSFRVHEGEIVGVTGLLGSGRSELTRIISGAQAASAGEVLVRGEKIPPGSPAAAIKAGIASVPQERRTRGCVPGMTVRENVTLSGLGEFWSGWWLRQDLERRAARQAVAEFDIRPADSEHQLANLSGGNQQKVVLAKWTRLEPRVLVLDEPTQGVDIGAKHEIATILRKLAGEGVALLIASSDFDELIDLCDRVLVLNRGEIVASVDRGELTEERLTLLTTNAEESVA